MRPAQRLIRLLLVDDHPIVREGIRAALSADDRLRVVGEASTGEEAVRMTELLAPDIVLMDITMPGMNGLLATRHIHRTAPKTQVLVLTIHDSREYVLEILRSGARGYVLKDASPDELLRAIEVVASGEPFFSPGISEVLLEQCLEETREARKEPATLSPRESQVLALVADGNTNKRIAELLGISVRTVESHRAHMSRKLGLRSAAELTRFAIQQGLIRIDQ